MAGCEALYHSESLLFDFLNELIDFGVIPIFYEAAQNDFVECRGFQPSLFYAALYKIGIRPNRTKSRFV